MGLIVDSSILIGFEHRRRSAAQIVEEIGVEVGQQEIGISVVTVSEWLRGVYGSKREELRPSRHDFLDDLFRRVQIYPLTVETATEIGKVGGTLSRRGITLSFQDLAIGLTAVSLGFELLTFNIRDFERIPGLAVRRLGTSPS